MDAVKVNYTDLLIEKWRDKVILLNLDEVRSLDKVDDNVILVCDELPPEEVMEIAVDKKIRHIVQKNSLNFEIELNSAADMITKNSEFLDYPMASILSPQRKNKEIENDLCILNMNFSKSSEKHGMLSEIKESIFTLSKSSTLMSDVLSLSDELITNAVFNAPFVDEDNINSGVSRSKGEVTMDEGLSGTLFMGCDGSRLVVGCKDPYGKLNLNNLFQRIVNCYKSGVGNAINLEGKGGAGIGSYMVYSLCSSYYAFVESGRATFISCCLPLKMGSSKRSRLPKNLHYFEK